ncbi:MAG: ribosome assembly RNA-binding protein YhbY [Gammaproteobacteria bacterium]|nr:ribosome assembly RNA-binding protein YhbY [Gammaproteobacteria bacterium]
MSLSRTQIKYLLSLTHKLNPVVSIGQNGITENVINELEIALNYHELVKIKIAGEDREARQAMIETLCKRTAAEKVQAIGKTLTLFRRNPEKPKIQF